MSSLMWAILTPCSFVVFSNNQKSIIIDYERDITSKWTMHSHTAHLDSYDLWLPFGHLNTFKSVKTTSLSISFYLTVNFNFTKARYYAKFALLR